jgi:predicted nucleotidyltransferase
MPINRPGIDLEKTVYEWLKNQQPSLSFVQCRRVTTKEQESLEVDFLVLSPMPMAIEVYIPGNHSAMMLKEKRFLYKRIALAERFGNAFPLIVVVPSHEYPRPIPYVDLVISAEHLPAFDQIKAQIRRSDELKRILLGGAPIDIHLTTNESFEENWSRIITLTELASSDAQFQEQTLAAKLHAYLQPVKERIERTPIPVREGASLRSPNRPMPRPKWFQRINRSESLQVDRIIFDFIEEKCGGRIEKKRYRDSFTPLEWNIWHSPSGKQVLIHRRMASVISLRHKLKEIVADAWLARAFSKNKFSAQVLLVGEHEPLDENLVAMPNEFGPMKIQYLNDLEASGWRVAPFDFDKAEPLLIKILKEVQND